MNGAYDGLNFSEQANHDARKRSLKRLAIIVVATAALIAIIIGIAVGITRGKSKAGDNPQTSQSSSIKAVCANTVYPDKCYTTLWEATHGKNLNPVELYKISLQLAMSEVHKASVHLDGLKHSGGLDPKYVSALETCKELLDMAYDRLNESASSTEITKASVVEDLKTWLSASLTYHDTCLDGFDNSSTTLHSQVASYLTNSTELSSNSLAILNQIGEFLGSLGNRKLLSTDDKGFPSWVLAKDRRLLQSSNPQSWAKIVVASDGSGQYKTISEGLAAIPQKSTSRTVIYVKKGVYNENVVVTKSMWNVMMVGDGPQATIVTDSKNAIDGTQTFKTASFSAFGQGFICKSMGFKNTAGPEKHQAVALMSDSDRSIFHLCRFEAYQDTLYTHSLRQFYSNCDIVGTIDFIFGNAAVVLQSCNIFPRKPMKGQFDTLTAQSKTDKNQNTGTSFHLCKVTPHDDLTGVRVYLGRPWKNYATVVYMRSFLSGAINPEGWAPWVGDSGPGTTFYAEFENTGPGASTAGRVGWGGVYKAITSSQASRFTVDSFIGGGSWIPGSGVPFTSGL